MTPNQSIQEKSKKPQILHHHASLCLGKHNTSQKKKKDKSMLVSWRILASRNVDINGILGYV